MESKKKKKNSDYAKKYLTTEGRTDKNWVQTRSIQSHFPQNQRTKGAADSGGFRGRGRGGDRPLMAQNFFFS